MQTYYLNRINDALSQVLSKQACDHPLLIEAMRYSCLNGGKRLRAQLVYASAALFGQADQADEAACSVEMIHAYSLIHDDLPAMDNSDLRRGKPSCHKAYGEAVAILAGDALQALAFEVLIDALEFSCQQKISLLKILALACGAAGMVGGQMLDILPQQAVCLAYLTKLNEQKTGALIKASIQMGAIIGQANSEVYAHLEKFADLIGLAYQIQDDILDIEQPTEILGKPQGLDQSLAKITFPQLIGLDDCKHQIKTLMTQAQEILETLPEYLHKESLRNLIFTLFLRKF